MVNDYYFYALVVPKLLDLLAIVILPLFYFLLPDELLQIRNVGREPGKVKRNNADMIVVGYKVDHIY